MGAYTPSIHTFICLWSGKDSKHLECIRERTFECGVPIQKKDKPEARNKQSVYVATYQNPGNPSQKFKEENYGMLIRLIRKKISILL